MKLRSLLLGVCVSFCTTIFAANQHFHPQASDAEKQEANWAGYCDIEIVNDSFDDIRVYGVYDNGFSMLPFYIYSFEAPYHISLFYYGYCHQGMNLYIDTLSGWPLYAGYTPRGRTVLISPYLANQSKVEVKVK